MSKTQMRNSQANLIDIDRGQWESFSQQLLHDRILKKDEREREGNKKEEVSEEKIRVKVLFCQGPVVRLMDLMTDFDTEIGCSWLVEVPKIEIVDFQ